MKKFILMLISYSLCSFANEAYDQNQRQTPEYVNDDHFIIRKIASDEKEKLSVSGGNIYFEINRATVTFTERIKIEEIAEAIKKLDKKIKKITVEGFASTGGDPGKNYNLAVDRAKAVKKELVHQEINESLIEVVSFGEESMYKFKNINKNRRVQIKIFLANKE